MTERVLKFSQVEDVTKLSAAELAEVAADASQIHSMVMGEFERRNAELAESLKIAAGLKPGGATVTPPKGAKRGRKSLAEIEEAAAKAAKAEADADGEEDVAVTLDA